jgi:NAD(P)-dependent dehydrogenase (short-subunit alcohol dehydrogenase family)
MRLWSSLFSSEQVTGSPSATALDIASPSSVSRASPEHPFGGLDVLVNNAGIMDRMSALADVDDAKWERVIRVNLTAPFLLTRNRTRRKR